MADYDINAVTRRVVYSGASGLGPYAFAFEILEQTDVVAYFNATRLVLTTDYTVVINSNGTGSVSIVTGGSVPSTPLASDQIVLVGARDIERTTDFVTAGELRASALNEQLDSLTIFDQQLAEENKRTIRAPVYDPALVEDGGVVDMTLPEKASRAGKTLAFDDDGNPVVGEDIGNWRGDWAASVAYNVRDLVRDPVDLNIYRVNTAHTSSGVAPLTGNADYAKFDLVIDAASAADAEAAQLAAEAARDAAQLAQAAAETAETNAELAETNAGNSATASAASATASASSASAAATSETNAATSETNAATSETNAASSASSASSSASTATTKASEASTSAANAATSETNAATSATDAETSAINALSRAGSAFSSASSAASSASSASSSQVAAEAARDSALAAFDNFDDKYLGEKASDPTVDNDGDPLVAGALYFNTTDDEMRVYSGTSWVNAYADGATFVAKAGDTMTGDLVVNASIQSGPLTVTAGAFGYNGINIRDDSGSPASSLTHVNGGFYLSGDQSLDNIKILSSAFTFQHPTKFVFNNDVEIEGDLSFRDNDKAIFGAGSDLEIYHDGSNSYIDEAGDGVLFVKSSNGIYLNGKTTDEPLARFIENGAVTLYHDNSVKLSTTSTGIDVAGTVTADGATFNGDVSLGDNHAILLGDEPNLSISHNATNSVIADVGGGNITMSTNGNQILFYDSLNSRSMFRTATNGRLELYYQGDIKLETKSTGIEVTGSIGVTGDTTAPAILDRLTSDGDIALFRKNGTTVGQIGTLAGNTYIGSSNTGLRFQESSLSIFPCNSDGSGRDNAIDVGNPSVRFDDIRATNGTIQTSDRNDKQQIASLTDAEVTAAKVISTLFKTFKWNDKVEEKGDAARTHTGVIAQDVQQAMTDAGLDAGDYAFFISDTWWEADGESYDTAEEAPEGATERTRLGIRYPELLAFVGAATEQRLASIETRLAALET